VFNPTEVTPELVADVAKKGEKLTMLFWKMASQSSSWSVRHLALNSPRLTSVIRYFLSQRHDSVCWPMGSRICFIVTWRPNKMDAIPFSCLIWRTSMSSMVNPSNNSQISVRPGSIVMLNWK
jgi:hypothetical protein